MRGIILAESFEYYEKKKEQMVSRSNIVAQAQNEECMGCCSPKGFSAGWPGLLGLRDFAGLYLFCLLFWYSELIIIIDIHSKIVL